MKRIFSLAVLAMAVTMCNASIAKAKCILSPATLMATAPSTAWT